MKKQFYIFTALFYTLLSFGQNFTSGGINYEVTNATAPFTVQVGTHSSFSGAANIPATVTNAGTTYSVTSIRNYAFQSCTGLTSVTIPNSITTIRADAFSNCTGLTSVTIPNSVTTIESYVFQGCTGLTSVIIPNSVTTIGAYTFAWCTGLTSVIIPNSVTIIGSYAFYYCTGLTSVIIPNSVTSTGNGVFFNCTGLTSVTVSWATPLAIVASVFGNVNLPAATLSVPAGTAALYDAAAVWTDFGIMVLRNTDFSIANNFKLYPNPATSNVNIDFQNLDNTSVEVSDINGRALFAQKLNPPTNNVNIEDLSVGVYLFKVTSNQGSAVSRVVKN
jgi:hypothetical protein